MPTIDDLKRIAEVEFADIVKGAYQINYKLRVILLNNSFIDVYLSQRLPDRFGFHWECMDKSETFYRYDNFPEKKLQILDTYPFHFHVGSQEAIESSPFPSVPTDGFRSFMEFIRSKLK